MADEQEIAQVMAPNEDQPTGDQQPPDKVSQYYDYLKKAGADVAPTLDSFKKTLANDSTARQYYGYLREKHFDAPPDYGSFARTLGVSTTPASPEHEISHTPVQDARHLNDLANQPIGKTSITGSSTGAGTIEMDKAEDVARNKVYQERYEKSITYLSANWGTDAKATKQVIQDFPDELDENKLKGFANLAKDNPVYYSRLKSANDIRMTIAKSGPDGIGDANVFNHLQTADNYEQLQHNIALQQEIMHKHDLGQLYFEKLKESQAPLINTLDPGLLTQYWTSEDKKLGLSDFQYAGLETEKMFNPGKYQQDVAIIRHNQGLDEGGQGEPTPQGKKGYAYDRGVENVLYALENQGRQNTSKFISQRSAELGPQIDGLVAKYKQWISGTTDPLLQQHFQQEFTNDPMLQEAAKIDEGQQSIEYAQSEDQRRFPLNYGDQASRLVKDAMSTTNGWGGVAGKQVLLGAGESADNTMRFIKNTYINLLGSEQAKAENAASNIGHQALSELAGYEGSTFSMQQSPLIIDDRIQKMIQAIGDNSSLSDEEKNKQATEIMLAYPDAVKLNPKAGQQNLTGKAIIYNAANTIGQILGIADQSLLMGGLLGDASKAQQMANAVVPMYASTQNQLYEQALARGDEKPLLSSHLDAAIISLASMINPDIKIVKGMVGAETGIGKMLAGVEESTWNKVLSTNKPLVDRMIAGTKATARQLGLANLQYGLIVPTAQYIVHKNVLNEDPNLGDAIKDGLLQTNISMAIPALFHGGWGIAKDPKANPAQKYAIVEAGLHPKENIELIDQLVEKGQIMPDGADQIKQVIKHAGDILESTPGVKSDGTPMNETEVADVAYQLLRKKILEGKLKNMPEPLKPAIEEQIHAINQQVSELHTAEPDKQKVELNQLLTENLGRIREKMPVMEGQIREAVKRNEPEAVLREIYDQATETTTVDGKEVSSRPAAEENYGKELVQKAIDLHGKKTAEPPKVEKPPESAAPGTTGAVEPAAPSSIQPTSDKIQPTDVFRTWDLGDMEGKPEDEAAKKHIEGVVEAWDKHPAGETGGETFGTFINRIIPAFLRVLHEDPNNTTITTHSSDLKAFKVWDQMGRPSIDKMTDEQHKEFARKFNATETENGDLVTFKGDNGDIHVIRHGETEDNAKNNFRSGNTNLTEKGVQDAKNVGQELKDKTGGDVPKIISSDLPRAIHTSNIISDALQESSATGVLQHPQEGTGSQGSERGGMEPGQQREGPAGESGGKGEGQEPPGSAGGTPISAGQISQTGIAERVKAEREVTAGVKAPEPGTGLSVEAGVERGRQLLKEGADPEKVMQAFEDDPNKNISADAVSIVRAKLEQLAKITDAAVEKYGDESKEAEAAKKEESDWAARIQSMQTEWSEIGRRQQGSTDLDTGTVTSIKRAFQEQSGKPLTARQTEIAKNLHAKIKEQETTITDLQTKLDAAHNADQAKASTTFSDKTKKAAATFRKLKAKEFTFKDSNGNEVPIYKMGITYNDLIELGAKAIEKTGEIADGIAAIVDKVKEADWYKGLSKEDKDRFGKELEDHYIGIADQKTASRIKALEKQLTDLESGNVKIKTERKPTAREQELKDQIFDAKQKLGLIKPKSAPQPKTAIQKPKIDIANHFVDKKDNQFTPEESKAIWERSKTVIEGGKTDFHDVVTQVANDTGLSTEQVRRAIAEPKGAKIVTDKMYAAMYKRNQVVQAARAWVKSADQSAAKKFWKAAIAGPSAIVTFGHGSVAPITHVGTDLYRPSNWKSYFNFMLNSYKYSFGGLTEKGLAKYEKDMADLVRDPMFLMAKKAGLKIDPTDLSGDDYSKYQSVLGKIGKMGERGFNAMKPYRLEQFKKLYNGLTDQAKGNADVLKSIAQGVNLSSGTTDAKIPAGTDAVFFAPKLVTSQYQRIFTEPAKAVNTFVTWSKATDAQKVQAKMVARHSGEMVATYMTLLAGNAAILSMTGSKQKINFTNPLDSDWMKFKMWDKTVDASGGMNSALRFVASLVQEGARANGIIKKDEKGKPGDVEGRKILQQLTNKLSPAAGDVVEVFSGTDMMGNPLPWSAVKPTANKPQLSWSDYLSTKLPIPIAEGIKTFNDAAKEQGMPKSTLDKVLEAFLIGGLTGTTGAKIGPDYSLEKKEGRTGRTGGRQR